MSKVQIRIHGGKTHQDPQNDANLSDPDPKLEHCLEAELGMLRFAVRKRMAEIQYIFVEFNNTNPS